MLGLWSATVLTNQQACRLQLRLMHLLITELNLEKQIQHTAAKALG